MGYPRTINSGLRLCAPECSPCFGISPTTFPELCWSTMVLDFRYFNGGDSSNVTRSLPPPSSPPPPNFPSRIKGDLSYAKVTSFLSFSFSQRRMYICADVRCRLTQPILSLHIRKIIRCNHPSIQLSESQILGPAETNLGFCILTLRIKIYGWEINNAGDFFAQTSAGISK